MDIILPVFFFIVLDMVVVLATLKTHADIEQDLSRIQPRLKEIAKNFHVLGVGISIENPDIRGREKETVMEETKRIGQLWKSRRERLQMGYWEKMEARAAELTKLNSQKEQIEELIRRTKVKYHKREIDEESFREIVKEYQKQLMEINVKIWELEKTLG